MAFMAPAIEHFAAYRVETTAGTELVPECLCGDITTEPLYSCGDQPTYRDRIWDRLGEYLLGCFPARTPDDELFEREEGWYGRLSANGYLDCTEWGGPYETAQEALDAVKEMYNVDVNGDEPTEEESEES